MAGRPTFQRFQMLQTSEDELARRAEALRSLIEARGGTATTVRVRSAVGGVRSRCKPWSWAVSPVLAEDEVLPAAAALRRHNLPVIARVSAGKLCVMCAPSPTPTFLPLPTLCAKR